MNSFVDSRKINAYSLALSEKIIIEAYASKLALSGQDIKSLTDIEQINLLVIKNLFDQWQEESKQLRSPYFDYENPEVKTALSTFLNTLSNYISIQRDHFKPLLSKAILETILIALSPKEFFIQEVITRKEQFEYYFINLKKFIRINTATIGAIENIVSESKQDWEKILNQISELEIDTTNAQGIIHELSQMLRIELNEILLKPANTQAPDIITKTEEVESEYSLVKEEKPSIIDTPETFGGENKSKSDKPPLTTSINDLFLRDEKSLNDKLKKDEEESSLSLGPRIQDLRKAISLNEKYLYVKELFENNTTEFTQVIETLETFHSIAEAREYLENKFINSPIWNPDNSYYNDFISLINRRF
jgi:hypothetical protein